MPWLLSGRFCWLTFCTVANTYFLALECVIEGARAELVIQIFVTHLGSAEDSKATKALGMHLLILPNLLSQLHLHRRAA